MRFPYVLIKEDKIKFKDSQLQGYKNLIDEKDELLKEKFIEKLENKYDTLILEGGNNLSLGQKQLISFARAIIADPRILILDEATSSIDTETEKSIQSAIKKIMQNRTSFIIAHRLSTIVDCDKIIVLDKGNIIEMGSHSELMNQKGEYYKLYSNQFINDEMKNLDFI